ncbi:hypothetical protein P7K49_016947 [Saguinus oedipus]|uniref:Uncharacterized protein n=1 Tax=Saguinus oedipus TaxID=9490 RepID=A0ABQ9V151_SAGOE|nr:hypothetical protein P7K49_016947 [Saguinus oedipus]
MRFADVGVFVAVEKWRTGKRSVWGGGTLGRTLSITSKCSSKEHKAPVTSGINSNRPEINVEVLASRSNTSEQDQVGTEMRVKLLREENEKLQGRNEELERRVAQLQRQIEDLKGDESKAKEMLKKYEGEIRQLEEALVHARKEEKEAVSARRALESELEAAQVNTRGCCHYSLMKNAQRHNTGGTPVLLVVRRQWECVMQCVAVLGEGARQPCLSQEWSRNACTSHTEAEQNCISLSAAWSPRNRAIKFSSPARLAASQSTASPAEPRDRKPPRVAFQPHVTCQPPVPEVFKVIQPESESGCSVPSCASCSSHTHGPNASPFKEATRNLSWTTQEQKQLSEKLKEENEQKEQLRRLKNEMENERWDLDKTIEKLQKEMADIVEASRISTLELQNQLDEYKEKNRRELAEMQRQLKEKTLEAEKFQLTAMKMQDEMHLMEEALRDYQRAQDEGLTRRQLLEQTLKDLEYELEAKSHLRDDRSRLVKQMEVCGPHSLSWGTRGEQRDLNDLAQNELKPLQAVENEALD